MKKIAVKFLSVLSLVTLLGGLTVAAVGCPGTGEGEGEGEGE